MSLLSRLAALALSLPMLGGCTTTSLLLGATGVATDTSMAWEIVKHVHAQITEGNPAACSALDSVERALNPRCGAFVAASVRSADIAASPFGPCALTTAARDTRLWPALPELLAKGARAETCTSSPIVALAQANECPDLAAQPAAVRGALADLARTDPRAVHHDVVRWLSCPASRAAGLDGVLAGWRADGSLRPGSLSFSPLAALHPSALRLPIAAALESDGHSVQTAFGGYVGQRNTGFEEALRTSDWAALDWWLARRPGLANRVPGPQLDWLPLARVIAPGYLSQPETRAELVELLLAHGADPRTRLPDDPSRSVLTLARNARSPLLGLLEAAPASDADPRIAANSRALRLIGR